MAERHYIVMACELWYNRVVYDNSPKLIYKLDRTAYEIIKEIENWKKKMNLINLAF